MVNRPTSGDNKQRRAQGREAEEQGKLASESAASTGASKQRKKVSRGATHEERLEGKNKGKADSITRDRNEARPGSRD
jgi:hypothetical protein